MSIHQPDDAGPDEESDEPETATKTIFKDDTYMATLFRGGRELVFFASTAEKLLRLVEVTRGQKIGDT